MKKALLITIFTLITLNLSASIKDKFPVKSLNDILKLENTIKTQITDNTNSIIIESMQIEIFNKHYLILDAFRSQKVNLYDKNGKYIKTVTKKGEGPGEFAKPEFMWKDKEFFTIYGYHPAKFIIFDKDLKFISEERAEFPGFYPYYAVFSKNKLCFLSLGNLPYVKKNITIMDIASEKIYQTRDVEKLSPMEKKFQMGLLDMAIIKDKLWVTRMFDPYIDVFDINTGAHLKTLGKDRDKRDYWLYSEDIKGMGNNSLKNNRIYFSVVNKGEGKSAPDKIINIDDKIILHGHGYNHEETKNRNVFYDVYSPDGELLQEKVVFKQKLINKDDRHYRIIKTSSKKLFLENINLTEKDEEDISSIIYQYGIKE